MKGLTFINLLSLSLFILLCGAAGYGATDGAHLLTGGTAAVAGRSQSDQARIIGSASGSPLQFASDGSLSVSGGVVRTGFGLGSILPLTHNVHPVDTIAVENRYVAIAVEGVSGPSSGRLYYRKGGENSYAQLDMTAVVGGDSLLGTISSSLITLRGIEYFAEVERAGFHGTVGTPSLPKLLVVRVNNRQGERRARLPDQRYRIITVPVDIEEDSSIAAIFEDDYGNYDISSWRLSRYGSSSGAYAEFPDVTPVSPGRGYWLITRDIDKSYGAAGLSVHPNRAVAGELYYEVALDSGWNQLGNPFAFEINWTDVLFSVNGQIVGHDPTVIEDSIYWYDGDAYRTISTIPAWDGFFLKVKQSGASVLFPYRESRAANTVLTVGKQGQSNSDEWTLRLSLASGNLIDGDNFVGVRRDAVRGIDMFDFTEPPRAPGAPMLAIAEPSPLDGHATRGQRPRPPRLRCDYRPSGLPGYSWKLLMSSSSGRSLSIKGIAALPSGLHLSLVFDSSKAIALTADTSIAVPDDVTTAMLLAGSVAFIAGDEQPLPRQFALYQNHPNPFNPSSAISFALPESRHVTLDIMNILGQKVSQLIDARLTTGQHSVTWYGRNSSGHPVASGVYFYRIVAGDFVDTKKMVLLR